MSFVLGILAIFGVLALLAATIRAGFRLLRGSAETFIAGEIASARAGRGDLSGLDAAREWSVASRAAKRLYTVQALGWLVLLIAPTFTPWTREVYAACAALWLLPRRRGTMMGRRSHPSDPRPPAEPPREEPPPGRGRSITPGQ
jgi:hypothetical protein